ncbi:TPA: hypothetical protein N0F65_011023 [Lagenidium giganteum]|uniref:DDE-1 domain-containing protein n=1 Tax=Lagenidium giganteum TaxID=4803 RepID=A0AAV2Z8C2_9STRA|nr:TPA: hypothetical protein N0F65_011023 [Lagenidium giganteum]
MPPARIPLKFTNKFKLQMIKRSTLNTWQRKRETLASAVEPPAKRGTARANKLTLGGSGRVSKTDAIEDALVQYIKDFRRDEVVMCRDTIVHAATRLMPDFFKTTSRDARSGRKVKEELEEEKRVFARLVTESLQMYCADVPTGLVFHRALFNMDQTAIFQSMGRRVTIDFIGSQQVPAVTDGSDSYRFTLAITASADGRILPPHFVFKGKPGGSVEAEVTAFTHPSVATFSVQENAWFDERVMLEWVETCWAHVVTEPSVLIIDSLKIHKLQCVRRALAELGTMVEYVPAGCTGVAQPLDVGVMAPFKQRRRTAYSERFRHGLRAATASERRRDSTIQSSFSKAGPFIPIGPSALTENEVQSNGEGEGQFITVFTV